MTKLNMQYKGFALGWRVADQISLSYTPGNELQLTFLHALKNLAHLEGLAQGMGLCGVNNSIYVGNDK